MGTTLLLVAMAAAYAYYVWDLGRDGAPRGATDPERPAATPAIRLAARGTIPRRAAARPVTNHAPARRHVALN